MQLVRYKPVATTLRPSNHPYLNGAWTPLHEEVDAVDLDLIEGEIPRDIDGVYLRNTENQIHQPIGRYHPFDGDGMLHQISFQDGAASYRNRWVRTRCFAAEQEAEASLWGGLMDRWGASLRPGFGAHGGLKDSSSTDVIVHAGRAVSTFYQCGEAYLLDPETLETFGVANWGPLDGVSAHPKVDERSGELMFFNYSTRAPYMHYGLVDAQNKLVHYRSVPLPGPRLPHDMAFTEHYVILNDLPLHWDAEALKQNAHVVRMHERPSRFAIVPRHGDGDIRWFEAAPTFVLHWTNAFEDGDEIVLDGYFQSNPEPGKFKGAPEGYEHMMGHLDEHTFQSRLHRWRFNLKSGKTSEERLDDRILEFGTINQRFAGRPYRYVYSTKSKPGWFLFTGFVKHDLETGRTIELDMAPGRYASEAPFAPRIGAQDEDDGYIVSFITDENTGASECVLIDCKRFADGPIARIALPHKVCSGTHACWADRDFIREGKRP